MKKLQYVLALGLFLISGFPVYAQSVHEITYTGSGFAPDALTTQTGDTVIWKNTSTSSLQVASDPHPVHNFFPFLNVGAVSTNGGTKTMIVSEIGTFTYHNHLNFNHTGTIIVEAGAKPGDANGDTHVDGKDYIIWLNNYNQQTTLQQRAGDFDSNGVVNDQDYTIWINNYDR